MLPLPLPDRTLLVGPTDWSRLGAPLASDFIALADHLVPAGAGADHAAPEDDSAPPLVILHYDHLLAGGGAEGVADGIEQLLHRQPDALPLLVYRELDTRACARLFQAGLFAALAAPLEMGPWRDTCARLAARRDQWTRTRAVRRQGDETARRLHAHRRQLQIEVAQVAEELIASQRRLELANCELTDHMSQVALLYRFGRELSSARNWDAVLSGLLESLARFLGARGAALVLRAAPGAAYAPRQTYAWEESRWDRILLRLDEQIAQTVADRLAPGVFRLERGEVAEGASRRPITALPLEHQGNRLGYLLLLEMPGLDGEEGARRAPFLQAVQVILAEEVAGAQMLDRIRELGAFNARVLDTVRSGIWVVDEQARTIYCNRHGQRLLGGPEIAMAPAEPDATIGRGRADVGGLGAWRDWLPHGAGLPELFLDARLRFADDPSPPFARLFRAEAGLCQGEGQVLRAEGETIPVLVQASAMPGRRRGERWLVLVLEDLREAKRLEAERIRADSLEGMVEMSAALAHEIRNPLMGLSAQAELLAGQLPPADPRKRYLDVITSEVERINGTITRLLQFVRPYEPRLAVADLAELARDCLLLLEPKAAERSVRLVLRLPPGPTPAAGWVQEVDAGQMKQVVLNLLLNALDASPAGGEIVLSLRWEQHLELRDARSGAGRLHAGLVLEVRDEGAGFSSQDVERLFRPFYSTKSAGTGLGLSICRKIVSAHGGEIRAAREGSATLFRVLLPSPEARALQQEGT